MKIKMWYHKSLEHIKSSPIKEIYIVDLLHWKIRKSTNTGLNDVTQEFRRTKQTTLKSNMWQET